MYNIHINSISSELPSKWQKNVYFNTAFHWYPRKKYYCFRNILFRSPELYKTNPSFPFKAQAAGEIHSSFRSLSNAINASTGEYLLESANKLFGEKSARFKEVSETCDLNGRAPNLQWDHFQSCFLWFIPSGSEFHSGSLRLFESMGQDPTQLCLRSLCGCFLFLL